MTSAIATDQDGRKRGPGRPRKAPAPKPSTVAHVYTFAGDLCADILTQNRTTARIQWPSARYQKDPVQFFRDVIGVEPWHRQVEIIEAVRDHKRVAVKSGHKVSKSHTAAGIALWFWCSFPDARIVMTSTTARQVDDILWREVRMMRSRAGLCISCKAENVTRATARAQGDPDATEDIEVPCVHSASIGGDCGEMARTGLKSPDFRELKGFTAREAEAVAGISGKNLLYILDEASGIKPEIFEAIEGNRAGGARVVMFSNPTRTTGEFFDAFNDKSEFYSAHTISSEETPNVVFGDDSPEAIPGLAGREWVEEKRKEWGEESPIYLVRVKGEFYDLEEGHIFPIHLVAEAEARWDDTPADGRLWIGYDPSGDGEHSDDAAWAIRRGDKVLRLDAAKGLSHEAQLMRTLGHCKEYRLHDREIPVVVMDSEGKVGAEKRGHFQAHLELQDEPDFELVCIRASDKAHRDPSIFDRQRDVLTGNLFDWIRGGGAIPADAKLAKEMHQIRWVEHVSKGLVKVTPKKEIIKALGRSPDRYDALALCVWEPSVIKNSKPRRKHSTPKEESRAAHRKAMDPYAGQGGGAGGGMDPYG